MRRLLLPLLLALALPAAAQSPTDPDPGFYLSVEDVTISAQEFADFDALGTRVEVGRRLGGGLEVGLLGAYSRYGRATSAGSRVWRAGVTGGLTRPSVGGTTFRLRGLAALGATDTRFGEDRVETSFVEGDLSATLGREVPVVGSVRLEPMVGAYAQVSDVLALEGAGRFGSGAARARGEVGLQLALPVRFRILGLDAALTPGWRLPIGGDGLVGRGAIPGTGFRIDF